MIYTPLTRKAMTIAYHAHHGQLDKAGYPYIHHPLHVAEQMTDELACAAALLHDVVEDTSRTLEDLGAEGIPAPVLEALALLTHQEGTPYLEYVAGLRNNPIARAVKLADLRHNSEQTRLDVITPRDQNRFQRYAQAIALLCEDQ